MKRLKILVYRHLDYNSGDISLSEKIVSISMLVLIILNIGTVIIETFKGLSPAFITVLYVFEIFSIVIFTIEYILRVWTADLLYTGIPPYKARIKFVFSLIALIDLASILPFYIPLLLPYDLRALRVARLFRLFRIMKVSRFTKSFDIISKVIKEKASILLTSILIMLGLLIVAATLMFHIENAAQPEKFDTVFSGFWWAIATLTTVGYGDIYPITALGKILSSIISIIGIGIIALPTSILSAGFVEHISKRNAKKQICPHCGKEID